MRFKVAVIIFFILVTIAESMGQKRNNRRKVAAVDLVGETEKTFTNTELFRFPNVNNLPYYSNQKLLATIRKLEFSGEWEKLYPILRQYVAKFGIRNFYQETDLIWRLAKLTETYGELDEAILLYKLVLKHHRGDIDIQQVELNYKALTDQDKANYVPLDYYYELVDYRKEVDTLRPPRGVLINMGKVINSSFGDYGPTLSGDDQMLVFTSVRNTLNLGLTSERNEDLFFAKKYGDYWEKAQDFEGINSKYDEGSACLSKDGKIIYFSRCFSPGSYGSCDLFSAEMQADSTWGNVINLGPKVNSSGWDSHPSLSHSEDTLYFASDRLGGFGLSDIYYLFKDKRGEWSKAHNAGPVINTRNGEVSPFIHHVQDVLYFSSNGQNLNFGQYDIYKSYRTNNGWNEPKNIGPLVNGPGNEFYFTIDGQSENLYYARSPENGNLDLYSFPLPMEAQPTANTTLSGLVTNQGTDQPVAGIVSIIDMENGIEVAPKFLNEDGTYEFDLINNSRYLLIVQGDDYFRIEHLFELNGNIEILKSVEPLATVMKFESINFGNSEAKLSPEMYDDLDKLADFLIDHPDFRLKISGHTDSDGREEFNIKLSQERADAIMEYIVFIGSVEPIRIEAKGFGSSQPIVEEANSEIKKLNRRVEFEIYRSGT